MSVRHLIALLVLLATAPLAQAQGFAGLGTEAEGFTQPRQGQSLEFPRDHGAHPDYRIEWWYFTANLTGEDGQDYGAQWTLFRNALSPEQSATGWQTPQVWMGNAALSSAQSHGFAQLLARGGTGQAGATSSPFNLWIDDWEVKGKDPSNISVTANGEGFSYDLHLNSDRPLVRHGDAGYSVKSREGRASYYYSQPAYTVEGQVQIGDRTVKVTGHAWYDHEWSSQPLSWGQIGWDWVSLTFDSGDRLMAFRLRGDGDDYTSGTWIGAGGAVESFGDGHISLIPRQTSQVAGREVPTSWTVQLPKRGVAVEVEAINPDTWMGTMFPYWEGPVTIEGSHTGRGYLEMTGY